MKNKVNIWRDATTDFPPFEKNVLGYYEIIESKKKKDDPDKFHVYFVVCYLDSISEGKTYKRGDWKDSENNDVEPTHWMELPDAPKK